MNRTMTSLVVNHQIFYPYEFNEAFVSNLIDPIGYYMNKLGLEHHSDHFREEEIDLEVLEVLEDEDMDELHLNEEEKNTIKRFQEYIILL
jgi:ribosome assembly protein YihI (activator of Der GTPase)